MQINLLTIGQKMPEWINNGYQEYAKRLPPDYRLQLIEIPSQKRSKSCAIELILQQEGQKLLSAADPQGPIIAFDRQGQVFSTEQLAQKLLKWHDLGENPNFLVGGPEGISKECLQRSQQVWSLSALTFPHPLVRVIIAEQIYRAWSILSHHPYHRA